MMTPSWIGDGSEIPDPLGFGDRAVAWLRRLKHPKNPAAGHPFQLDPWQERIVRRIYGPRDDQGRRIVRRVVLLLPRGNRKTSLAAALALLHITGPERAPGSLVVSAASAHEQARELFQEAALIVEGDRRMNHLKVRDYTSTIVFPGERSRYVAVASDGKVQHGKTPNVVIADELHAWEGRAEMRQWEALDSALVKVAGTLMIVATTSGRGQENLAWKTVEYAIKVQKGEIVDPATLPVIFMAEESDDWADEALWHAVNPGLAHGYPDLDAFRDKVAKAAHSPFERDSFLQFSLNRWLDTSTSPFVEMPAYDACAGEVDLEDMETRQVPCWIGVDLSKNEDLTAVVACWRNGDEMIVWVWFFCPEDALRTRGERHGVEYVDWADKGFIIPTKGNVVDLRAVEDHIRELAATYSVREVAFDPTYARIIMANLQEDGIEAVEFRQGWVSMAPAVKELERVILAGKMRHGGHPVLRWNFSNVQVETDKAGNRMFHKGKSGNKIDGAVACAMAVARAAMGEEVSVYEADWFDPITMGSV